MKLEVDVAQGMGELDGYGVAIAPRGDRLEPEPVVIRQRQLIGVSVSVQCRQIGRLGLRVIRFVVVVGDRSSIEADLRTEGVTVTTASPRLFE